MWIKISLIRIFPPIFASEACWLLSSTVNLLMFNVCLQSAVQLIASADWPRCGGSGDTDANNNSINSLSGSRSSTVVTGSQRRSGRWPLLRLRKKAGEFGAWKRLIGKFLLCTKLPSASFLPRPAPPLPSGHLFHHFVFSRLAVSPERKCAHVCVRRV